MCTAYAVSDGEGIGREWAIKRVGCYVGEVRAEDGAPLFSCLECGVECGEVVEVLVNVDVEGTAEAMRIFFFHVGVDGHVCCAVVVYAVEEDGRILVVCAGCLWYGWNEW